MLQQETQVSTSSDNTNNIDLNRILTEFATSDNRFQYDYFLNFTKQKQSKGQYLINILQQLRPLVHILEPNKFQSSLVDLIFFDIKWNLHSKNELVFKALSEFLIELNSAYTSYIYKCLSMVIKNFLVVNSNEVESLDCQAVYAFSHQLIGHMLKIAPSCKTHLLKQIDTFYPYMTKDTLVQEAYILNVLQISDYAKDLRLSLLETCIQKVLKVDVNCTREQIIDAELNFQPSEDQSSSPDLQICMQLPLADRLDTMIEKLYAFIKKNSLRNELVPNSEENWEATKSMYKDLLFTFDKYILCTYGSSHVQFLMFYICSFKSMLSEGFLDYLWKKFSNPASCHITKQICTYYIGSFLARAKYIHINTCVATIQLIVTYIHNYIEKYSIKNYMNFDIHRTFYSMCQTLFYVIIFRHQQLFGHNTELVDLIKSWKLNDIVSCKLNPLRYCLPTIRKKFARVAYVNQVTYCYSIIDANNRVSLPTTSESAMNKRMFFNKSHTKNSSDGKGPISGFLENPLDSFFPFDPFLLKRSKPFIEGFYQEFQSVIDEEMELDSDMDDEDDFDTDSNNGNTENSDTESKTQFEDDSDVENST